MSSFACMISEHFFDVADSCFFMIAHFFPLVRMAQGVIMWSPVFSLWDLLCVCWGVVTLVCLVDLCLLSYVFRCKLHTAIYASMRDYFWNLLGSRWYTLTFILRLLMFVLSERYPVYVLLPGGLVYTGFRAIMLDPFWNSLGLIWDTFIWLLRRFSWVRGTPYCLRAGSYIQGPVQHIAVQRFFLVPAIRFLD